MSQIKKALISVWNKEGIVELGKFLSKNNIEIISTGGTEKVLKNNSISVTSVSSQTFHLYYLLIFYFFININLF